MQYFANSTNSKSIKTMRRSFKKGKKLFTSRFSGEQSASVEGKLIKMLSTDDNTYVEKFFNNANGFLIVYS